MADVQSRPPSKITLLRMLTNAFERQGWRDDGETALEIVSRFIARDRRLSERDLSAVVPTSFYTLNDTSRRELFALTRETLSTSDR